MWLDEEKRYNYSQFKERTRYVKKNIDTGDTEHTKYK